MIDETFRLISYSEYRTLLHDEAPPRGSGRYNYGILHFLFPSLVQINGVNNGDDPKNGIVKRISTSSCLNRKGAIMLFQTPKIFLGGGKIIREKINFLAMSSPSHPGPPPFPPSRLFRTQKAKTHQKKVRRGDLLRREFKSD